MPNDVKIIRGTNDKPVASAALVGAVERAEDLAGYLFIGYPVVGTSGSRNAIDALLISPDHGIIVFDLVEGGGLDEYKDRQDEAARRLEARLLVHGELT